VIHLLLFPMKTISFSPPTLLALLLAIITPLHALKSAPVNESFAYPLKTFTIKEANEQSNRVFETFLDGGSGWSSAMGDIGWIVTIDRPPGQREYFMQGLRIYEFSPVVEGSLVYQDAEGKALSVEGNHLRNSTEAPQRWQRDFSLREEGFLDMVLEGFSPPDTNLERSTDGIGGPGVIWFCALLEMQNSESGISINFVNAAYPRRSPIYGLTFRFQPQQGRIFAGQDWSGRANRFGATRTAQLPKSLDPTKPFWMVAKITFGEGWGTSEAFAEVDATKLDGAKVEATGNLMIWINPALSNEPSAKTALVNIPLLEFRFSRLLVDLPPGCAIDEIRLGKSFEEILTP